MKIRTAFVANSSSSAFLIAIGKITNYKKFKKWFKQYEDIGAEYYGDENGVYIVGTNDDEGYFYGLPMEDEHKIELESFDGRSVSISKSKVGKGEKIFFFEYNWGDDNDFAVYYDGKFSHMDYDIYLDDFPDEVIKMVEELKDKSISGVNFVDYRYGAGRDG